jgi:hypothetical protein
MPDYPYVTHLDIRYPPLTLMDVPTLAAAVTDKWFNQTLCKVNDSVIRVGTFLIDLEDKTIELSAQQGFVVPKGIVHRTRAPQKCVILMVEGAGIVPTGD